MALTINKLIVCHSGGTGNVDPTLDLGGARSTAAGKRVTSQTASALNNLAGFVTVDDCYGNPEGVGSLSFTSLTNQLGWKPYGLSTYYGVNIASPGTYLIGSSSGYMVVTTTTPPGADKLDSVTISNNQHNVFPLVSEANSLTGIIEYRCLYVLNSSASDAATDVRIWINSNTPGGDNIAIGLDPVGLNGTATTIAAPGIVAPGGVSFSQPVTYGTALVMGNIPIGQHYAFWQRRTVPPETRGTVISNGAVLAIAATI
jgi:hypothetical protein